MSRLLKKYSTMYGVLLFIFFSSHVTADDGTQLMLTGEIKASPCTVDTIVKTVNLGTLYISKLKTQGDYVKFSVTLSACPAGTSKVMATFSGSPDATSSDWYYANSTDTGAATGIHIALATDAATVTGLGNGKTLTATVDTNKKVEFKLQARVDKDATATATPGFIQTMVNITYAYS